MRKGDAGFISVRFPVTSSNIENTPSAVWSDLVCFLRDGNYVEIIVPRSTTALPVSILTRFLVRTSILNEYFVYIFHIRNT